MNAGIIGQCRELADLRKRKVEIDYSAVSVAICRSIQLASQPWVSGERAVYESDAQLIEMHIGRIVGININAKDATFLREPEKQRPKDVRRAGVRT